MTCMLEWSSPDSRPFSSSARKTFLQISTLYTNFYEGKCISQTDPTCWWVNSYIFLKDDRPPFSTRKCMYFISQSRKSGVRWVDIELNDVRDILLDRDYLIHITFSMSSCTVARWLTCPLQLLSIQVDWRWLRNYELPAPHQVFHVKVHEVAPCEWHWATCSLHLLRVELKWQWLSNKKLPDPLQHLCIQVQGGAPGKQLWATWPSPASLHQGTGRGPW